MLHRGRSRYIVLAFRDRTKGHTQMKHRHEHDRWPGAGEDRRDAGRGGGDFGFGRGVGFGPPWARGMRGRGGPRMRRGDIRIALLSALTDGPAHGYELIQRLEQRTDGRWRPSP